MNYSCQSRFLFNKGFELKFLLRRLFWLSFWFHDLCCFLYPLDQDFWLQIILKTWCSKFLPKDKLLLSYRISAAAVLQWKKFQITERHALQPTTKLFDLYFTYSWRIVKLSIVFERYYYSHSIQNLKRQYFKKCNYETDVYLALAVYAGMIAKYQRIH